MQIINVNRFAHYSFFIVINQVMILFAIFYFFTYKGQLDSFWWNHFKLTNLSLNLILILLVINFFFLMILKVIRYKFNISKMDYFFALANLSNFLPVIFLVNTFFTFLFILEVNSCLVFYKFVVSKIWYNDSKGEYNINYLTLRRVLPKNYLNMLFFQYWATFFSSVMIMFSLIYYIYVYGTTEWIVLNLLNKIMVKFYISNVYVNNTVISAMVVFAFLIKIGFTPLQLYKIEIYKGIPYVAIFFYTTYYFLVFFLFFILLLTLYLNSFLMYWWYILLFIIVFGGIYVISLLFDINFIKAFFAYSTMVNSLGFLTLVMALLI